MITRSEDYVEFCREVAHRVHDVQDLALRGKNKADVTRRILSRVLREVDLTSSDQLVDIGCGDGTLLRMAKASGVENAVGLLATEEEAGVVRRRGLRVRQGLTHQLPIADQSASVVVCNNVLLVVPRERIPGSLREIERIARPGARIYLGEIPFLPGPPPEPEFATVRAALTYFYKNHGVRATAGILRRIAYWKLTGKPMIIRGGASVAFYAEPAEFIPMVEAAGLELVRYWPHDDWPEGRFNYLFRKPEDSTLFDAFADRDRDLDAELALTSAYPPSAAAVRSSAEFPW